MISKVFIDRPVFSIVLSIVIVLAGLAAVRALPVAQYPDIVPPQIVVQANYPGASAEVIAETVASPLEQQINGVEGMLYMASTSTGSGGLSITVTFEIGTDPDQATIDVNNRVQRATANLPEQVRRQGINVSKRTSSILQVVTMSSRDGNYGPIFISNYALVNVLDDLKRLPGVGDAQLFGAKDYSMRIWLRPDKLAQYELTPGDVAAAVREQNSQFAAGRFGAEPMPESLDFTYTVVTPPRLDTEEAFGNIILKSDPSGAALRLKDVARIELGAQDYTFQASYNGTPAVAMGIFMQPGANALDVAGRVEERLEELSKNFPEGIEYNIPFDTTTFVEMSIEEVVATLLEAVILVICVVYLFLQNIRATIIPLLAVPVSIIGTLAGMYLLGFSINLLTLFGMVLAIGIVVDDAIVVLENFERIQRTEGLSSYDAAVKAMQEVSGPVVAIVLVLCAVFIPVGFMGGLTGGMYQQFAITIAVSVTISGFVALTLTPTLCAMLKPAEHEPAAPFRWFNGFFERTTERYTRGVAWVIDHRIIAVIGFAAVIAAVWGTYRMIPSALVPDEDQGYIFTIGSLPSAASLNRTIAASDKATEMLRAEPEVDEVTTFAGFDVVTGGPKGDSSTSFINLKDWSERTGEGQTAQDLVGRMMGKLSSIKDATFLVLAPPPIRGMSSTGGFEAYLQDRTGSGIDKLIDVTRSLTQAANQRPELSLVYTTTTNSVPQYRMDVDRDKAKALGVPISSIFETLQSTVGVLYVNDFTLYGRTFKVNLQSEPEFRRGPEDLKQVFVRAESGRMIPLNVLVTAERIAGPELINRFNVFPSAKVNGNAAPGYSSGEAITAMEEVAAEVLPEGYTLAWLGSAYQERVAGGTGALAFIMGLVMVFLILAALYERWRLPIAVMLAVPFAVLGAFLAVWLRGLSNDVYLQVGLLVLIGLSAKNAILIVEFAFMRTKDGWSRRDAAIEAARLRFRPIVMTSMAFILGCVPLAIASGAGAGSRQSIGTGVIGGMLAATFIATFFIPWFFTLFARREVPEEEVRRSAPQPGE